MPIIVANMNLMSLMVLNGINWLSSKDGLVQIPTRIPEKIVVALFSGILVISGILVVAG